MADHPHGPAAPDPAARRPGTLAWLGLAVAVLSGLGLLAAGAGYRAGWWTIGTGFTILRWSAYGGVAGAILSLAGALVRRASRRTLAVAAVGLVIGAVVAGTPWRWEQTARAVPPIHDITTDLEDPPAFDAILPLRANAPNSAVHGGDAVAAEQRRAYPDIGPVTLPVPAPRALERAEGVARDMGWEIVAVDRAAGRLEATDTTLFFGFKDDVVVRVRPSPGGSRVDVRSVSRVGRSDAGTNAARIREFVGRLRE